MSPARWSALCRAWHRKTRRPVPGVAVTVRDDFFEVPAADDPRGQRALGAAIARRGAAPA